jgi:UDP-N-acetylmuramyl tripeptide synthase
MRITHILLTIIKRITFWELLYPHMVNSTIFHMWHQVNAMIASAIYSDPTADMVVVGVTGTDGKTTTVNLLHHVMTQL